MPNPADFPDDLLEAAAARVADLAAARERVRTPWLRAEEAAEYLRAPVSRVRKLTMMGTIPHEKDGRRVLYHRDELDAFLRGGGSYSP